jgi:hypothetical protein
MLSYHWVHTASDDKSATRTRKANDRLSMFTFKLLMLLGILVALPGLEPGLFALRARTKDSRQRRLVRGDLPLRTPRRGSGKSNHLHFNVRAGH